MIKEEQAVNADCRKSREDGRKNDSLKKAIKQSFLYQNQ